MFNKFSTAKLGLILGLALSITSCQKDTGLTEINDSENQLVSSSVRGGSHVVGGITFYALAGNILDKYSTTNPENLISSATITGLQPGERILGIDFRPATGQLYALGSNSRLYIVNPTTGVATLVAPLTTTTGTALALSGTSFGFDFNPVVDRIRIVSNTGQNLRANPMTGVTLVDGSINPQPASVNGVAYDNNDTDPTTGTELYALDVLTQQQFEINPPNAGTLVEPLGLNVKITGDGGFDIAPRNANVTTDIGLALYEINKKSTLFSIDVETGDTRILAKYRDMMYSALAISPAVATN